MNVLGPSALLALLVGRNSSELMTSASGRNIRGEVPSVVGGRLVWTGELTINKNAKKSEKAKIQRKQKFRDCGSLRSLNVHFEMLFGLFGLTWVGFGRSED